MTANIDKPVLLDASSFVGFLEILRVLPDRTPADDFEDHLGDALQLRETSFCSGDINDTPWPGMSTS
jgi:hypothetical protein